MTSQAKRCTYLLIQRTVLTFGILLTLHSPATAEALRELAATLAGQAIIPCQAIIRPLPQTAPEYFAHSGRFANPRWTRSEPSRQQGADLLPTNGQLFGGVSGIARWDDSTFVLVLDNGYGAKGNSADWLLSIHFVRFDWSTRAVRIAGTSFLRDPNKHVPFPVVNEITDERYLTGADLDPESIACVGKRLLLGDEFGPYMVEIDSFGVVAAFHEVSLDNKLLTAPEHFRFPLIAKNPGTFISVQRSKGFEAIAARGTGESVVLVLEGPVVDHEGIADGSTRAIPLAISDDEHRSSAHCIGHFPLGRSDYAIGDLTFLSWTLGLVIERDNGEGDSALACSDSKRENCFSQPARHKRLVIFKMAEVPHATINPIAYIDLLDIADPSTKAVHGTRNGVFCFPFATVESVVLWDEEHVLVANDNNLGLSSGRIPGQRDNTEFVLLHVPELKDLIQRQ